MRHRSEGEAKPTPRLDSTLFKGLSILEALADAGSGKGVTDLSRELGLNKSNTFRLLQTLSALGYVQSTPEKLYRPTMKTWKLGLSIVGHLNLAEIAGPQMVALAKSTSEAVYLAIPDGLSVLYIDKIDSSRPITSFTPKGGSAPMHCVGTGKALLAASYDRLRSQIKDRLTRYTDRTITSIGRLDADVGATLAAGFATDLGEYRERIHSFGSVIRLPNQEPVAAIGVSVPDIHLPEGRGSEIGALVLQAARQVSEALARL